MSIILPDCGATMMTDVDQDIQQLDDIPRKYQFAALRKKVISERLKKLEKETSNVGAENAKMPINSEKIMERSMETQKHRFKAIIEACDTEAQHLVETYAKSTCLSICEQMQEKLPRELRDMIYSFLLPISTSPTYSNWVWAGKGPSRCIGCGYEQKPRVNCRRHGSPHMRSAEYLGIKTVIELAETWYRTSVFEFSHESTLDNLLQENPWNLPFQPTKLINEVHINLSKFEFMEEQKDSEVGTNSKRVTIKLDNLLSPLSGLKSGAKIAIRIIVFASEWIEAAKDSQRLIEMLQPTFTAYKRLHEQGYHVEILERYGEQSYRDWRAVVTAEQWVESNRRMFRPG